MINSSLSAYLYNIDNLRNIDRYQIAHKITRETVAEHSFFVASYILKLHDYYNFNLEKALNMGLLHDFSEVFISDVPHPIKMAFPDINKQLEKAEYEMNEKYISKEFADNLEEFNNLTSVEGKIVNIADILSVISYSKYEVSLGNSQYMKDVLNRGLMRIKDALDLVEDNLKPEYKTFDILSQIIDFSKR